MDGLTHCHPFGSSPCGHLLRGVQSPFDPSGALIYISIGGDDAVGGVGVGGANEAARAVDFADVLGEIPVDSEPPLGSSPYGRVSVDTRPACLTAVGRLVGVPSAVFLDGERACGDGTTARREKPCSWMAGCRRRAFLLSTLGARQEHRMSQRRVYQTALP